MQVVKDIKMKIIQTNVKNQRGFALLHILPAFLIVASIAFIGGQVYQTNQKKQEAARIATADAERQKQSDLVVKQDETSKEKEVDVPEKVEEEKPVEEQTQEMKTELEDSPDKVSDKPSYTTVAITNVTTQVSGDTVTLTATLPNTYSGVCAAKVKLTTNYDKKYYSESSFSNKNTCSVTFSKTTLSADGNNWIAFMSWHNNEYTIKGYHDGKEFSL
jgi:Tfp pilus assembly major pilin PilA